MAQRRVGAAYVGVLHLLQHVLDPSLHGPLLQLGIGFHSELSGRENAVLQGTLLGRSRAEMEARMVLTNS